MDPAVGALVLAEMDAGAMTKILLEMDPAAVVKVLTKMTPAGAAAVLAMASRGPAIADGPDVPRTEFDRACASSEASSTIFDTSVEFQANTLSTGSLPDSMQLPGDPCCQECCGMITPTSGGSLPYPITGAGFNTSQIANSLPWEMLLRPECGSIFFLARQTC